RKVRLLQSCTTLTTVTMTVNEQRVLKKKCLAPIGLRYVMTAQTIRFFKSKSIIIMRSLA
ncbi:hypothetical protein SJI19_16110, partial [Acerihabitans sp. TG2]|uniref:hypothetical protein n=1 Tax=Acerihabitans sp. TG2 TaxID=3096008 RepID=UPI002B2252C7